jgi:hypothetical protein
MGPSWDRIIIISFNPKFYHEIQCAQCDNLFGSHVAYNSYATIRVYKKVIGPPRRGAFYEFKKP